VITFVETSNISIGDQISSNTFRVDEEATANPTLLAQKKYSTTFERDWQRLRKNVQGFDTPVLCGKTANRRVEVVRTCSYKIKL